MPNYSITVNSKFKPFTYQEMLAPLLLATLAHQDIEEKYGELEAKANMYEKIANSNPGSKAASMYKQFSEDLKKAADELAINGLSPSSKKAMLNMKSRYSSDILPIEYALAALKELAKKASAQNPQLRMVYQEMPSIDDLIDNPNLERVGYSGADIEKSAMTSATAASARQWLSEFSRDPKNAGFMKQIQQMGYNVHTMDQIKAIPELNAIIQLVKDLFGYGEDKKLSKYSKDKLDAEILSGLFKGVAYKENASYQQDPVYMANLNHQLAKDLATHNYKLSHPDGEDDDLFGSLRYRSALNPSSADFETMSKLKDRFLFSDTSPRKGKLKPTYFGKVYKNPLKIYEEYKKLSGTRKEDKIKRLAVPDYDPSNRELSAKNTLMKKYGVSAILTDKEAEALYNLGYTSNSTFNDFKLFNNRTKSKAKEFQFISVNVPDLSVPNDYFMNELNRRNNLRQTYNKNAFKGTLWYEGSNGKLGNEVEDLEELTLQNEDGLTDVSYSSLNPDKISVSLGKHTLYADPNLLGTTAADLVNSANKALSQESNIESRNAIAESTTVMLRKILQNWNPNPPKTKSSKK